MEVETAPKIGLGLGAPATTGAAGGSYSPTKPKVEYIEEVIDDGVLGKRVNKYIKGAFLGKVLKFNIIDRSFRVDLQSAMK